VSIFSTFFSKKEAPAPQLKSAAYTSSIDIPSGSYLAWALSGGGRITAAQAYEFYRSCAAVATAVDLIADEIEAIEPVLIGPDGQMIVEHEVLSLLRTPNPAEGYRSLMGSMARNWLLTHDSFVAAEGSVERLPVNLWSVKSSNVSVTENAVDRYPQSYYVSNGPGSANYERKEIRRTWRFLANSFLELHRVTGFSSQSGYSYADSPLQAAALEVRQQIMGRNHNLKLLENGGRLSMVATFKDTLEGEQHEQRRADIQRDLGGAGNAGKIAVISSEDMTLEEFGSSNKDMDYQALDKISSIAIFLRYKIPLPLVSTDASTYNNMEQAKFDLYDRAVLPAFNVIAEGLTTFLMPKMKLDPKKFKISYNPEAIVALRGRLLEELKIRKGLNLETTNELRSMLPNREPLTEGGDKLYQAGTLVPIADDVSTEDNLAELTERARDKLNG